MRILLAGPDDLFREGLKHLLKDIDAELVYADAGAIKLSPAIALDLALFDLDCSSRISAVSEFRARFPDTPLVVFSSCEEKDEARRTLEAGAAGYIPKSSAPALMLQAIKLVQAGGSYLPPLLLNRHPADASPSVAPVKGEEPALTPRQLEVLGLVAKGESNKAMARRLGISEATVKTHMQAIFQALQVKTRSQAAIAASKLNSVLNGRIRAALRGETSVAGLLSPSSKRHFKRNELLFRKGDQSRDIYYISSGTVHLEEINANLQGGDLLGEIGLFTPDGQRTCTARCRTDGELFSVPAEKALRVYCQDPEFAVFVTHLVARRLIADRARLESV